MQKHITEIYFSQLKGRKIIDITGHAIGRVKDIVTLWSASLPVISGILYSDDRDKLIPADLVQSWDGKQVALAETLDNGKTIRE